MVNFFSPKHQKKNSIEYPYSQKHCEYVNVKYKKKCRQNITRIIIIIIITNIERWRGEKIIKIVHNNSMDHNHNVCVCVCMYAFETLPHINNVFLFLLFCFSFKSYTHTLHILFRLNINRCIYITYKSQKNHNRHDDYDYDFDYYETQFLTDVNDCFVFHSFSSFFLFVW